MGWVQAAYQGPDIIQENDVQRIFSDWGGLRDGVSIAGAPKWLDELSTPDEMNRSSQKNAFGYRYRPDLVWHDPKRLIGELKYGAKYEPLALAEVLHHAEVEHLRGAAPYRCLVLTQALLWTRLAVSRLRRDLRGPEALLHIELDYLRLELPGRPKVLWCNDPHAEWHRGEKPLPAEVRNEIARHFPGWQWRAVAEADTWIGAPNLPELRESVMTGEQAFLSRTSSRARGAASLLLWKGRVPQLGGSSEEWEGKYFAWVPDVETNVVPR